MVPIRHQQIRLAAQLNSGIVKSWFASVAQLAEQLTLNQLVLGSSPSRGTTFITYEANTRAKVYSEVGQFLEFLLDEATARARHRPFRVA